MYRTGSSGRVSDEFFSSATKTSAQTADGDHEQQQLLPTHRPESHPPKKDKIRFRSAETAVHSIPLVLILCAAILWFCSAPVDMSDSIAARVKI
ncbi:Unknown protein [Striga hermonthica]|uniref:Uncharacterized protein n=1 Tax=Striga hermonthica TaxID=68872 RepID=A0A9N7RCC6_STRHE|nr:Unknown protein [Striga hermonthica]